MMTLGLFGNLSLRLQELGVGDLDAAPFCNWYRAQQRARHQIHDLEFCRYVIHKLNQSNI